MPAEIPPTASSGRWRCAPTTAIAVSAVTAPSAIASPSRSPALRTDGTARSQTSVVQAATPAAVPDG